MSSAARSAERRLTLVRSIGIAPEAEGPECRLPVAVEEVVGRRGDDRAVAQRDRQAREQQAGVEVAGVVGGEDHRAFDRIEVLEADHAGRQREVERSAA